MIQIFKSFRLYLFSLILIPCSNLTAQNVDYVKLAFGTPFDSTLISIDHRPQVVVKLDTSINDALKTVDDIKILNDELKEYEAVSNEKNSWQRVNKIDSLLRIIERNLSSSKFQQVTPLLSTPSTVVLSGVLKDWQDGSPLFGAALQVESTGLGATSNMNGTFSLTLTPGQHQIRASYIGYNDVLIDLHIYENAYTSLELKSAGLELEEITISANAADDNVQNIISGVEKLDQKILEIKPKLMGEVDVLRSIQTLSGVTSVGDGASGFNVRGGKTDENLILQDGALIFNPSHTLGFFSLFHPDIIRSVNLYKGDQPANFGGRLSSVLEVNLQEGDMEEYNASIGLGLISSRLKFEGPIKKGVASILIGGRGSYLDWFLNRVNNKDIRNSKAQFYDLTTKATVKISNKTKLNITGFISGDEFRFADKVNFEYETKTISGFLNHLINDKINLRLMLNAGDYKSSLFDINGNDISKFSNDISYVRGELKGLFQLSDMQKLSVGIEANSFQVNPGSLEPNSEESIVIPEFLDREQAIALSPYLQYDIELNDQLGISAGLRYTNYSLRGPAEIATYSENQARSIDSFLGFESFEDGSSIATYSALEPRFSIRYFLSESSSFKFGFNQTFQYLNQISNTSSATPIDLWKLSDFHIQPQKSNNFSAGYFKNFNDNVITSSLQLFYRSQNRIIEYKDFADLVLNPFIERELVDGTGRSYGAELNFSLNTDKQLLQLNYTYSKARRMVRASDTQRAINDGAWFNTNYDKPHSLFMTWSYKVKRRAKMVFNFTYSTGRPTTAPISNFQYDNLVNVPIFSDRNQFRIPSYHRLDFSYIIGPIKNKKSGYSSEFVFSVFNVYARRNAYSVFFEQNIGRSVTPIRVATLATLFPSLTINIDL